MLGPYTDIGLVVPTSTKGDKTGASVDLSSEFSSIWEVELKEWKVVVRLLSSLKHI